MGTSFFDIFASSPFKPMQKHMSLVFDCVLALETQLQAALAEDWNLAASLQLNVAKLEQHADGMKKEIRLHLPNSIFMPVSRSDILGLLKCQDKIANKAKDIAGLVLGRKMIFPDLTKDPLKTFVKGSVLAVKQAKLAVDKFDELLETGFRGYEADLVEKMIQELDHLECKTDADQVQVRALLFQQEKDMMPIDVIFLYKIFDYIGELADYSQQVGHRLELLLAK